MLALDSLRSSFGRRRGLGLLATLRENYAYNAKRLIRDRGMTQRSFAKAMEVDEGLVSKWLNQIHFPEDRFIDKTVAVLRCTYEELFRDPGGEVPDPVIRFLRDVAKTRGYKLVKDS